MTDRIIAHAYTVRPARLLLWLLIGVPFLLAVVVGVCVRASVVLLAACIEGYRIGRG